MRRPLSRGGLWTCSDGCPDDAAANCPASSTRGPGGEGESVCRFGDHASHRPLRSFPLRCQINGRSRESLRSISVGGDSWWGQLVGTVGGDRALQSFVVEKGDGGSKRRIDLESLFLALHTMLGLPYSPRLIRPTGGGLGGRLMVKHWIGTSRSAAGDRCLSVAGA